MDKNKICEALYALSGNVVVKRRKFQLLPAVLFVAGAALIVVNNMYGADLTNNLRSSIVFIGGIMVVAGMIMAAAQMFGSGGAPSTGRSVVSCSTRSSISTAASAAT